VYVRKRSPRNISFIRRHVKSIGNRDEKKLLHCSQFCGPVPSSVSSIFAGSVVAGPLRRLSPERLGNTHSGSCVLWVVVYGARQSRERVKKGQGEARNRNTCDLLFAISFLRGTYQVTGAVFYRLSPLFKPTCARETIGNFVKKRGP